MTMHDEDVTAGGDIPSRLPLSRLRLARLPLALYGLTIFLSAFLLFQVQPIIGKIILPWFGGSAAVWTTCLLFFQIVLLLGYLYAHGVIRYVGARWQPRLHIVLLAVSLLALHMIPSPTLRPHGGDEPVGRILLVLLLTIGLPYFLLSTTSPLLQAWFDAYLRTTAPPPVTDATTDIPDAPVSTSTSNSKRTFAYRLYALSNTGSLLALLSYPLCVEPYLTLRQQSLAWSIGYTSFVLLGIFVAWKFRSGGTEKATTEYTEYTKKNALRPNDPIPTNTHEYPTANSQQPTTSNQQPATASPSPLLLLLWVLLSACSSTLLLAVSNHLAQNVAAMPFLWVLPLSLYLLSFIWCFGGSEWRWHRAFLALPYALIGGMVVALNPDYQNPNIYLMIPLFAGGLFVCCVLCHGELARLKPDTQHLTLFYLMLSIGGALGGVFVAILAPRWFPAEYELSIAIACCLLIALFSLYREERASPWEPSWIILAALTCGLIWMMYENIHNWSASYRTTVRNFYGVLRVMDSDRNDPDNDLRTLVYGTIQHGNQLLQADKRRAHLSYYGEETGLGLAIRTRSGSHPERVGVIGLGTGSIASYGRKGDVYRYYEINPLVRQIAQTEFFYLRDCPADIRVVMGDARLSLETGTPQNFDVLAVDAFSSDAIPVHLLTREAFEVYFRNLKPDGILAVHVSNRYLNLTPVVASIARSLGKEARMFSTAEDDANYLAATEWVLVSNQPSLFKAPLLKKTATSISIPPSLRPWTDDYSNLYQILRR